MFKYILKRIGISILLLVAVSLIIYFILRLMPVDFVTMNSNLQSNPEQAEMHREALGLDDNSFWGIIKGYGKWVGSLFEKDAETGHISLGQTFSGSKSVAQLLVQGIPYSFIVAAVATVFEFLIAIPLGITAATHQYSFRDYFITVLVMIGISLPSFFFANIFKTVFAEALGWFPVSGAGTFRHYVLPIFTISVLSLGGRMRMTRTNMLEVLNSDYIRTARAKGLSENKVINKHAFRNTLIPLVTTLAGLLPSLFSGAIITEQIFGLPGIGKMALEYTNEGDIPFIMGYNMFLATLSVVGILLADIMYAVVDPRVKLK
ncbi:MAG: ABC transporter permease [Clostridia bacterium]|nr:ABC transporter permease [Clostridia bacterium]